MQRSTLWIYLWTVQKASAVAGIREHWAGRQEMRVWESVPGCCMKWACICRNSLTSQCKIDTFFELCLSYISAKAKHWEKSASEVYTQWTSWLRHISIFEERGHPVQVRTFAHTRFADLPKLESQNAVTGLWLRTENGQSKGFKDKRHRDPGPEEEMWLSKRSALHTRFILLTPNSKSMQRSHQLRNSSHIQHPGCPLGTAHSRAHSLRCQLPEGSKC